MPAPLCPACESAQTQTIKLMCLTAANRLAAQFTPLPEPSPLRGMSFGLVAALLGLLLISQHPAAGAGMLALGGILVFAAWGKNVAAARGRSRRLDLYERGWICLQCGVSWIPKS